MHCWLKVGGAEFLLVLRTQDVKVLRNCPWFGEWNEATMNIVAERDTVKFLAKHCPCSCLDNEKQQHKNDPNKKWCHKCHKLELDEKLLVCGKCQLVRCCSAKVSSIHWVALACFPLVFSQHSS